MTQPVRNVGILNSEIAVPQVADLKFLVILSVASIAVCFAVLIGGMQYLITSLALGLAVLVYRRPQEATSAGVLFMLAAMTLLPSEARFHYIDASTEGLDSRMYFWAAGSLVIALAALYRTGPSSLWRAPASLKVFVLVVFASVLFGLARGNQPSYVIRQSYGAFLFAAYFMFALVFGNEDLFFQRLKVFATIIALLFMVYYASVFAQWGFHKEDTSLPVQMGIFATLLLVKALADKQSALLPYAAILFTASALLFMRHVVLTLLFAAALVLAVRIRSRLRKWFSLIVAGLILLPSVLPVGAQIALDFLEEKIPGLQDVMPVGTTDTKTLVDRSVQLVASVAFVAEHPVLGGGMGTEFSWSSDLGDRDEKFVDNGWAYLAVKMGLAGILSFGWLLFDVCRCMSRASLTVAVVLIAILLIGMFSEPFCFQYTMSPIAGVLAGLLYSRKHSAAVLA